ncbi:hypothetical protein RB200_23540 [Streptomyces sp. PmtG]
MPRDARQAAAEAVREDLDPKAERCHRCHQMRRLITEEEPQRGDLLPLITVRGVCDCTDM